MVLWRAVQVVNLLVTVALLAGLFFYEGPTLAVLWNVLIPLLPATFLIAPALWRGICPLATLNLLTNGLRGRRPLPVHWLRPAGTLGIALLFVLVPARRFLFNEHGFPLALIIVAVALAALGLGAFFDLKAGFCNAFCPVLPVEKLYGQHPFVSFRNPRCATCTLCTPKGCLDLSPRKSALQATTTAEGPGRWLRTPYGVFAAAFPGFIAGYFTTTDGPLATAPGIYLHIGLWALGSYLLVTGLVRVVRIRAAVALTLLAGISVGLYYFFATPSVISTLGLSEPALWIVRTALIGLALAWLVRGLRRLQPSIRFPSNSDSSVPA
ncbi:MAG: hypothetical protein D6746_01385 [Bacteroidetes bacterium]|nr:MAG: hypothetical protein D6746_01385 [Bacteroidota bacterium]